MTVENLTHTDLERASALMRAGNPQAARPILAGILQRDAGSEQAWMMLSHALDDPEGQMRALRHVLEINPQNEQARMRLNRLAPPKTSPFVPQPQAQDSEAALKMAASSIKIGENQAALNLLAAVIGEDPDNDSAWLLFSYALDDKEEQIEVLEQAVELNPNNLRAQNRLAKLTAETAPPIPRPAVPREVTAPVPAAPTAQKKQTGLADALKNFRLNRINWPLLFGSLLVLFVFYLAIEGPNLAPRNPMEENHILRLEDGWMVPPFGPGTEGFPLGSDQFGRDLLSQLLWAVRPTLVLVLVVASIRLGLGVLIGLMAGWWNGLAGSAINLAIQAALAIPVMLVALGVIARVGIEHGVWVFIAALSFTGWADTAQVVRSQTQTVRNKEFVEAAYALGGSSRHILRNHILRHVTPLLFMLFSFEVGATMLVTGGLGFLGYYLGGDALIQIDDFTQLRAASRPELGQMLATTLDITTEPFGMVVAGSMIFLVVLGFNLVGKGLRLRVGIKERRRGVFANAWHAAQLWLADLAYPFAQVYRRVQRPLYVTSSVVAFAGIIGVGWWGTMLSPLGGTEEVQTSAAVVELATEEAEESSLEAVTTRPTLLWKSLLPDENYSPPMLASDGSIAIADNEGQIYVIGPSGGLRTDMQLETGLYSYLDSGFRGSRTVYLWPRLIQGDVLVVIQEDLAYGLDLDGNRLWEFPLEARPRDCFTSGQQGELYMVDRDGALLAFGAEGPLWQVAPPEYMTGTNSWPVVGGNGNIYYTLTNNTNGYVQAVTPQGEVLWFSEAAQTVYFHNSPQVSATGDLVILDIDIFDGATGAWLDPEMPEELSIDLYAFGEDGGWYYIEGNTLTEWTIEEGRMVTVRSIALQFRTSATRYNFWPLIDREGNITILFFHTVFDLIWMEPDGSVVGQGHVPDRFDVLYFSEDFKEMGACGRNPDEGFFECYRVTEGFENPAGYFPFEDLRFVRDYTYRDDLGLFAVINTDSFLYLYAFPEE